MQRSLSQAGSRFQSIGSSLTAGVTLPLLGAATVATKFASDFEASTTKLVTLSGVSEVSMKKMRQAVLDLAPTVGIGPRALSDALLVVTSTGFEGAEAMEILSIAAKSSAIGMGDTKDIARALTAAISAYGAENLSAAAAGDILHATVVAGGAEASELAGEIGRVVGVASQLGVSFSEVGAFIATYTRLGISASEATTGLSGVLNTILAPSKEAKDALMGIGLSADMLRSTVAEQGLGAALSLLLEKLGGNAEATGALFGNVRALAGVLGTAGVQSAGYAANLEQIRTSTGNVNAAFAETKKTFAFQWNEFKAQAEKLAITLGTQLLPAMTGLLQAAKPVGEFVAKMIGWFAQLPQPVQTAAFGILGLGAALGPVSYAIGTLLKAGSGILSLVQWVGKLGFAGTAMSGAWTTAVSVFEVVASIVGGLVTVFGGWAVLIGGAVIAGVVALGLKTGALQAVFSTLWDVLKGTVGLFVDLATIVGKGVLAALSAVWGYVSNWSIWKDLASGLQMTKDGFLNLIPDVVKSSISWATTKIKELLGYIHTLASVGFSDAAAPKTPGAPSMFGGSTPTLPSTEQLLAIVPTAKAGAASPGTTRSKEDIDAAKRTADAWKKVNDEISGKVAIGAAKEWMQHLADVGGLTKITDRATQDLNRTLDEAISAYALAGQVAPQAMLDTWAATLRTVKITNGLQPGMFGEAMALPTVPDIAIPNLPKITDGGLFGESLGVPTVPAQQAAGAFRDAFHQLGQDLPGILLAGLQRGASTGQIFGSVAQAAGSQLTQSYQTALQSVGGDFSQLSTGAKIAGIGGAAITGGMNVWAATGGEPSKGKAMGKGALAGAQAGMAFGPYGAAIGAAAGALVGLFHSIFGTAGRDKVKDFVKEFGGFDTLHDKLGKLGTEGEKLWIGLTQGVGRNNPAEAEAAIKKITEALENRVKGIEMIMDGVAKRGDAFGKSLKAAADKQASTLAEAMKAAGVDQNSAQGMAMTATSGAQFTTANQGEFDRVGAMALGGFGAQMSNGGSAIATLTTLGPMLDTLNQAQSLYNFTASETTQRLLDINAAVNANLPAFEALEADGQILNGMLKANWADMGLFAATSSDVAAQIAKITEGGMPMSQALGLNQPVLQSLWEAQQKFGFAADEATQALLDQAVTQGIVGPQMKDVNKQILDVLLAIGKVLGADIPAALAGLPGAAASAAAGMNSAFGGVTPPRMYGEGDSTSGDASAGVWDSTGQAGNIVGVPALARGGIVRSRPGGTLVRVGEGGADEAVVPLPGGGGTMGRSSGSTVIIEMDGRTMAEFVVPHIPGVVQRYGLA